MEWHSSQKQLAGLLVHLHCYFLHHAVHKITKNSISVEGKIKRPHYKTFCTLLHLPPPPATQKNKTAGRSINYRQGYGEVIFPCNISAAPVNSHISTEVTHLKIEEFPQSLNLLVTGWVSDGGLIMRKIFPLPTILHSLSSIFQEYG